MVICFVVLIWSAVSYNGYVFLKLAQDTAGEADVMITPQSLDDIYFSGDVYAYPTGEPIKPRQQASSDRLPFLNFTRLDELMENSTIWEGFAP